MKREETNPYRIVREENNISENSAAKIIETIGYDALGRKVMFRTETHFKDGTCELFLKLVDEDGFWGGRISRIDSNGKYIGGCIFEKKKFAE